MRQEFQKYHTIWGKNQNVLKWEQYYSCKENWNKGLQIQGILSNKHIPRPRPTLKHFPNIPTHPSPQTTLYHHHTNTPQHTHTHPRQVYKQVTFPLHATRINKYINR